MLLYRFIIIYNCVAFVRAYTNNLFILKKPQRHLYDVHCSVNNNRNPFQLHKELPQTTANLFNVTYRTMDNIRPEGKDPMKYFQKIIDRFLFGRKVEVTFLSTDAETDAYAHFPQGSFMRAELFNNKSSVHLPMEDLIHPGHCYLHQSKDYMQTAVDAFSIFLHGTLEDILHLPAKYVLRSARTIAMMRIEQEKLAATWVVVKENRHPDAISYETLEMYRPLFKYLNGREIARLNLTDERILYYIGTHPELDRHQVGVVASRYIQLNPLWNTPTYLNLMNNLLCGVPLVYMRTIPPNTYLQLSHQLFYHVKACLPLHLRFYFAAMTKTQALGKSYSWSAREVSRLGLLLSEIQGSDLSIIKPEAMAGLSAQVVLEIPAITLKHITEKQLQYVGHKALNIIARKLKIYDEELLIFNGASAVTVYTSLLFIWKIII